MIHYRGGVQLSDAGRPQDVFCAWKPRFLKHEVLISEFLLLYYPHADVVRGHKVERDYKLIRPDARMVLAGVPYFVEFDAGTMKHQSQLSRRWNCYRGVQDYVLIVTLTDDRLRNLVGRCNAFESVRDIALFTTLGRVKADPYGDVWVDCSGTTVALPKPVIARP